MQRLRLILVAALVVALAVPSSAFGALYSSIWSVRFVSGTTGYMSGRIFGLNTGFVSKTTDGGKTWTAVTSPFKSRSMVGVDALDATNAWSLSDYWKYAWKTSSGGASWSQASEPISSSSAQVNPAGIAQFDTKTALVVGQQESDPYNGNLAVIWRTADGGASWQHVLEHKRYPVKADGQTPWTNASFKAIDKVASAPGTAWVVGYESAPIPQPDGQSVPARSLIYKTYDSGLTWTQQSAPPVAIQPQLKSVAAVSATVAWAAGASTVMRTTDGGATWKSYTLLSTDVNGIDARSDQQMIAVGAKGKVARTTNGGSSWQYWTTPSKLRLNSVAMLSDTKAIAAGDDGLLVFLTLNSNGTISGTETRRPTGDQKTATLLSISAPSTVKYNATAALSGTLKSLTGSALSGRSVSVQWSSNGTSWSTFKSTTTNSSGQWAVTSPALKTARYFRAYYAGSSTAVPATSPAKKVLPAVVLSTPTLASTQTYGSTYSAAGYLQPKHPDNTIVVQINAYHYEKTSSGKYDYVYKKAFYAKSVRYSSTTTTKYTTSVKLPYAGKWRVRAVHVADLQNALTYSAYTYVTVKRTSLSIYGPKRFDTADSAALYGYLKYATSTGSLSALTSKKVYIQRLYSTGWKTIGSDYTSSAGRWDYKLKSSTNATLRAYYPGSSTYLKQTSSSLTVTQ